MGNWLHHLWFTYGWPSDMGNGPEGLQQALVGFVLAVILIPRVRRFFGQGWGLLHEKLDSLGDHHRETQRILHHVIKHHPDIPDLPEKEDK